MSRDNNSTSPDFAVRCACVAVAVMALERIPSDIRKDGGVARMTDPKLIKEIQAAVCLVLWSLLSCG